MCAYARAINGRAVAIGARTVASGNGAVAIGNGAVASRSEKVALGNAASTYTFAGISSAASKQS